MATTRILEDAGRHRGPPPLGNGREDSLSDEDLAALGRDFGPESQGAYAREDYGAVAQGAYGDEDFDPSYQRDGQTTSIEPTRTALEEMSDERRRDDDAVQDDVVDVLTAALPGIRELHVSVERGEVALDGVVEDRATELEAYRLAARIPGVVDLAGRLRVAPA